MMGDELKCGRGRPKKKKESSRRYHLVLSEDDFSELERFCRITGESKADFIRAAITNREKEIESERAKKFAYLTKNYDEEEYFEEYEEEFDDDF